MTLIACTDYVDVSVIFWLERERDAAFIPEFARTWWNQWEIDIAQYVVHQRNKTFYGFPALSYLFHLIRYN